MCDHVVHTLFLFHLLEKNIRNKLFLLFPFTVIQFSRSQSTIHLNISNERYSQNINHAPRRADQTRKFVGSVWQHVTPRLLVLLWKFSSKFEFWGEFGESRDFFFEQIWSCDQRKSLLWQPTLCRSFEFNLNLTFLLTNHRDLRIEGLEANPILVSNPTLVWNAAGFNFTRGVWAVNSTPRR